MSGQVDCEILAQYFLLATRMYSSLDRNTRNFMEIKRKQETNLLFVEFHMHFKRNASYKI